MSDTRPLAEKLRELVIRRTYEMDNPDLERFEESLGIEWIHQEHESNFGAIQMEDGSEWEITVQPKGLAELQAGLIADLHKLASRARGIRAALDRYYAALASLSKPGGTA